MILGFDSVQLLSVPTPGTTNAAPATLGEVGSVRFNEWLAASLDGADWFELFNPEPRPVSLAGRYLTDSASFVRQTKFTIGPLTFIPAGGFVSWVADGKPDAGPDHVDFNLDARGEMLRLNLEPTIPIDTVPLPAQFDNVSEGRLPDGATPIVRFPESPTPGRSNFLPLPDVVISEVP